MIYNTFSSPLGTIIISTNGTAITSIHFIGEKYFEAIPPEWVQDTEHPLLRTALQQVEEYFEGKRKEFDLPLVFEGGTPFQKEVWLALQKVPFGKVTSYGMIAKAIHRPKAVRAVGGAIGKNPLPIVIPCHRIIGKDGAITGYAGGLDRKEKLLQLEGYQVTFK